MSYHAANEAKATFDEAYTAPTPHAYVDAMARTGYEIGEQARPYCVAAAELLKQRNGDAWPAQMLDVGCSYGMGAAFVKYGCSFDEIVAFFSSRAPTEYWAAREAMRVWLNVAPPACDLRTVGLDSSEPAIRFAVDSGLLDGGIAKDFEQPDASPSELERSWFRSCNLLISTGAIGYVTDRTLEAVLEDLGQDHPGAFGPLAVVTILRMFDAAPIEAVFERHGLRFGVVPDIRLPQRRFADARERRDVLATLEQRGIDTEGWEDRGKHYADLYVATPAEHFGLLVDRMTETRLAQAGELQSVGYIHR